MSRWHHLRDKATGEEQFVSSLNGHDLDRFEVTPVRRPPADDECFDPDKKKLVKHKGRQAEAARQRESSNMALLEKIENLERRLVALERESKS